MTQENKRSSIRVNSKILLKMRKISGEHHDRVLEDISSGMEMPCTDCLSHPVLSFDIKPQLKKLREKEDALATILDVLDQKLSFIIQMLRKGEEEARGFSGVHADLSSAGIAFTSSKPLPEGQFLEMQIGLLPDYVFFFCLGRVVRVDNIKEGLYKIAVKFTWINEDDRERLIEYLFQRQIQQLKMRRIRREQQENS